MARRAYGTGSLIERTDKSGRVVYYGKWRTDAGRQIMRRVGDKRAPGSQEGLTKVQAAKELRRVMDAERTTSRPSERLTFADVGARYLDELRKVRQRKKATVDDYRIMLNRHFVPFFGDRAIDSIEKREIDAYVRAKLGEQGESRKALRRRGRVAAQTVTNQLNFLHGVFEFAVDEGWAVTNPVRGVRRPKAQADEDIHFLDEVELEALLRAVPDDEWGDLDRVLYLTAAITGLRQGELVALRWRDVDWVSKRIRVRRSRSRGELGTPKSKRSSRAVPMADRVAAELDRHSKRSRFNADDQLVFADSVSGSFYDASKMRKRFKAALLSAGVRDVRFHDLRHTFGTRMAGAGVPMRTLQEWMGHADYKTTLRYADYAPSAHESEFVERAFASFTPAPEPIAV